MYRTQKNYFPSHVEQFLTKKHQSFLKLHTPHSTTLPATLAQCLGFLCHQLRGRVSIVVVVVYPPIKEQSQIKGYYIGIPYLLIYRRGRSQLNV